MLLLLGVSASFAAGSGAPTPAEISAERATLESALMAELDRSRALHLADTPAPYAISYDVLDGSVATTFAEFGATV